jgi:hypothetical protein
MRRNLLRGVSEYDSGNFRECLSPAPTLVVQHLARRKKVLCGPVAVGRDRQKQRELIFMEVLIGSNEGVQHGISSGYDHIGDAADWPGSNHVEKAVEPYRGRI